MQTCEIVLATASPRRRALISKIKGVKPIFMPVDVTELVFSSARETATVNARLKGECAVSKTELPVLAFDTVVGIGDKVLGKPKTREQAVGMFELLCGKTHEVITAVYLNTGAKCARNGKKPKIIEKFEKTKVTFGAFDKELVYNYVDGGYPFDKAGGYNIDDPQIKPLIIGVNGEYDNVVGLPVALTEKLLEENLFYGEDGNCA